MVTVGIVVLVSLYVGTLVLSCIVCWGLPAVWAERFEQILDGTPAIALEPPGGVTIALGSGSRAPKSGTLPSVIVFGPRTKSAGEPPVRDGCICWVRFESQAGLLFWRQIYLN